MPEFTYVQDYPKNNNVYRYAYIRLATTGGCLSSIFPALNKLFYQVLDEDFEESIYDSKTFNGGWASIRGIAEYNQTLNYMTQNDWLRDGEVYCEFKREYLPRYRKAKL